MLLCRLLLHFRELLFAGFACNFCEHKMSRFMRCRSEGGAEGRRGSHYGAALVAGRVPRIPHRTKTAVPDAGSCKRKAKSQHAEKEALVRESRKLKEAILRHRSGSRDHWFGVRKAGHEKREADTGREGCDGERGAVLAARNGIRCSGRGRGCVVFHRIVFLSLGSLLCEQVNDPPGKRPDED